MNEKERHDERKKEITTNIHCVYKAKQNKIRSIGAGNMFTRSFVCLLYIVTRTHIYTFKSNISINADRIQSGVYFKMFKKVPHQDSDK